MLKFKLRLFAFLLPLAFLVSRPAAALSFLEQYPDLKKYLYREPQSHLYMGLGVSPLSILKSSVYFTANIFQVHWINRWVDIEFFSASFGTTIGQTSYASSTHFTVRSAPKYRINDLLSVGPVVGYEFVEFPNLNARLFKGTLFSPMEPFSSQGWIFGGAVSETFHYSKDYIFKVVELVYQQTYPTDHTSEGWNFFYDQTSLNSNASPIQGGTVFMIEFSILY
jgi:hypothetical protein